MSRVKRQARKAARQTKRATNKAARQTKRTARKVTRQVRRGKAPARPVTPQPQGLADLTNAPGMKEQAGGPSLNEISQGATSPGEFQSPPAMGAPSTSPGGMTGGLSGIQNDPFKSTGGGDFGAPDMNAGYEPEQEQQDEPQEVEVQEIEAPEGEGFSDIIGEAIGGIGQAVGGILKGLNINTGARKKAKGDAAVQAYQARAAAALAAAGGGVKKSNTGLYIGIGVGAVVLILVIFFVMKKKK